MGSCTSSPKTEPSIRRGSTPNATKPAVYGFGVSQPSRSVCMFCKVTGIPFKFNNVDLKSGEQKKDAYLKISPLGQVPCLVDGGATYTQCPTIMKYLAAKYKVADHWFPSSDLKVQARINEYLDWQHTGLRQDGTAVFRGMIFTPMITGNPIDEEQLATDTEKFEKTLGVMENRFLGNKMFLAGDKICIADICAISELMQVLAIQRTDVLASHPKLKAWKDRVVKHLNPAFDEEHKLLMAFTEKARKGGRPMSAPMSKEPVNVYGFGVSQPTRSVCLFCKINGIPFKFNNVDLPGGEHKKAAFLAISPLGEVPCIVDGGTTYTQCPTIIKYLAAKYKVADHWFPSGDLKVQARINEYLDWQHTGLRQDGTAVFRGMVFTPLVTGAPIDEEKLATDTEKFDKTLGVMENRFLGNKEFLGGDKICIADICAISELMQVLVIQRTDMLASHPKLRAWKDRVAKQLDPHFNDVNKVLLEFCEMAKNNIPPSAAPMSKEPVNVYGFGVSQPTRSVCLFCKINGIPFKFNNVDLPGGEHKKEAFMKISPLAQVPCIVDGGTTYTQCPTIMKYLAAKYKVADHWFPSGDLKVQARINEYLDWQHTGLRQDGTAVFRGMIFTPLVTGTPIDEEKLAADTEKFDKTLGVMENRFLGNKMFLCGDKLCIADICAISELMQVLVIQRTDVLASYPKLKAWKDRVVKQLNPAFDEEHKCLVDFIAKVTQK
ncbi:uncharacterized protein [Asterias amurensis]|uniref:uncharacterized protein n=1 Tax=Asterias amurensis TaxID=7602 RepID=UPI003AB8F134